MPADASGDRRSCTGLILIPARFRSPILSADPERLEITCRARRHARPDWRRPHVVHPPNPTGGLGSMASPRAVHTMSDLRVRVIETVMAAVRIAQYRAAAAHAAGDEAEVARFESEVREAEQRLERLRTPLQDPPQLPRYDYLA
jgi:hypothetical protein